MTVTIYHNPRCSKSRQTLQLLMDQGIEPEIVEYLKTPPNLATLKALAQKLGLPPSQWVRKSDAKELGIALDSEDTILKAMAQHPILIERPIVVKGDKAALGRPPENVLKLLS